MQERKERKERKQIGLVWGTCGSINLVRGPSSSSSSSSRCFCPSNAQGQQPFARRWRDGTVPFGRSLEPIDDAIQHPSPWAESDMSSGRMLMDWWAGGGGMPFDETASFCNRSAVSPTPLLRSMPVASNQPMSAFSVRVPHHASPKVKGISNHFQDSIPHTPSQAPLQVQYGVSVSRP